MTTTINQLINLIDQQVSRPAPPAVHGLADEIRQRYGHAVQAILFYGSCFRSGDAFEGLVDLYVLVDGYRSAYDSLWPAFLNKLLPPNVFYLEIEFEGRVIRSKYTVFSMSDFEQGTSMRWYHSYLWGRFCQPVGLVYARNKRSAEMVKEALGQALLTFMTRAIPALSAQFEARELWRTGLMLSYRSELRSERTEKLGLLFDTNHAYFEQLTATAIELLPYPVTAIAGSDPTRYDAPIPKRIRFYSRIAWHIRFWQGKLLSVLRLLKALFTFQGGVDYILWKIERHSGVTIEATERLRRIPVVGLLVVFWRLYRRGAFR